MMPEHKSLEVPKSNWSDKILVLIRAALSAVPIVGSPAVELLGLVVKPSLDARLEVWRDQVGAKLEKLQQQYNIPLDKLQENQPFVDVVFRATEIAIRNYQEEKWDALCNAIVNSALQTPPDESRQQMFLNYIDTFTVWHIKILKLLLFPNQWFRDNLKSDPVRVNFAYNNKLIAFAFPELTPEAGLHSQVCRDLETAGLINGANILLNLENDWDSNSGPRSTKWGREFVKFISNPESANLPKI